jgi:uncharacterized membrane protein YkvA (DUF1232 family)
MRDEGDEETDVRNEPGAEGPAAGGASAPGAAPGTPPLAAHHLLPAYDRLRRRALAAVERRGGRLGADAVRVLLLVPDIFLLLVRLVLDKEVPAATRALIGSVLAYFILPVDLLPEGLVGGAGFLDDMVLATAILAQVFGGELEPYARKHWSGPEDLRVVLRDVTASAHRLLSGKTRRRLQEILSEVKRKKPPATGKGEDEADDAREEPR